MVADQVEAVVFVRAQEIFEELGGHGRIWSGRCGERTFGQCVDARTVQNVVLVEYPP